MSFVHQLGGFRVRKGTAALNLSHLSHSVLRLPMRPSWTSKLSFSNRKTCPRDSLAFFAFTLAEAWLAKYLWPRQFSNLFFTKPQKSSLVDFSEFKIIWRADCSVTRVSSRRSFCKSPTKSGEVPRLADLPAASAPSPSPGRCWSRLTLRLVLRVALLGAARVRLGGGGIVSCWGIEFCSKPKSSSASELCVS